MALNTKYGMRLIEGGNDLINQGDDLINHNTNALIDSLSLLVHDAIPANVDFNTLTTEGRYPIRFNSNANGPGYPGVLYVGDAKNGTYRFITQVLVATDGGGLWYRTARDDAWEPWLQVGQSKNVADTGASSHEYRKSEFLRRRGGRIGTAGKAVVSLRFDHHLTPFTEQIVPLLDQYRLPWAQAVNPANLGTADDLLTYTQLQDLAINHGGEVWNHGRNHGNATTVGAMRREIVQSRDELQAGLPALAIEGFMPPGLAAGGYGGLAPFETVEQWSTVAGRMILAEHAITTGYMGGRFRPLGGAIVQGHSHQTMDTAYNYHWTDSVKRAISTGTAITFMLHPSALVEGKTTTAILDYAFNYIAQQRDAGLIEVLTPSAAAIADIGSDYRRNLLPGTDTTNGPITVDVTNPDARGAVHELTGTGTGTVTVKDNTGKLNASSASIGGSIRAPFVIPLNASSITITSDSPVTDLHLTAA